MLKNKITATLESRHQAEVSLTITSPHILPLHEILTGQSRKSKGVYNVRAGFRFKVMVLCMLSHCLSWITWILAGADAGAAASQQGGMRKGNLSARTRNNPAVNLRC